MQQIEPGVYMFSRASIYQYALVENGTITLIDAGLQMFGNSLVRDLTQSFPNLSVESIIITHADGDHYGAARRVLQTLGGKVSSSAVEAPAICSGRMSRQLAPKSWLEQLLISAFLPVFDAPAVPVDHTLEPGQVLPILGGLQVLDSAGHTPGHLSFYHPELRILFAGDSIVERNKIPSPAYGFNCWDESLARQAFERQMALNPVHLCCGHSYFNLPQEVV